MSEFNLSDIYSKEEIAEIGKNVIGRELDEERELKATTIEFYDPESEQCKLMGITVKQKLTIPIYGNESHASPMYFVQILSNGLIKYVSLMGRELDIENPFPVYEALLNKKEDFLKIV